MRKRVEVGTQMECMVWGLGWAWGLEQGAPRKEPGGKAFGVSGLSFTCVNHPPLICQIDKLPCVTGLFGWLAGCVCDLVPQPAVIWHLVQTLQVRALGPALPETTEALAPSHCLPHDLPRALMGCRAPRDRIPLSAAAETTSQTRLCLCPRWPHVTLISCPAGQALSPLPPLTLPQQAPGTLLSSLAFSLPALC